MTNFNYAVLVNILNLVLSFLILNIYLNTFLDKRTGNVFARFSVWILYILWQIFLMQDIEMPIYMKLLISTGLITIICSSLYKGDLLTKIIIAFLISIFWAIMEFIAEYILLLFNVNISSFQFAGTLVSKIMTLGIIRLLQLFFKNENIYGISEKYKIALLIVIMGNMLVVYNIFAIGIDDREFVRLLITFLIMLMDNVIIFKIYLRLAEDMELKRANTVYEQQLELCTSHMHEKEKLITDFRNIKHDIKQHFIVLKKYLDSNDTEIAKAYLETQFKEIQFDFNEISKSDNIIVDAIVNSKYMLAKKYNIKLNASINIPMLLPFESGDISVLLGNILDNAIEASMSLTNEMKVIELTITYDKNILVIVCSNNYLGNLVKNKRGVLMSSKEDYNNHGFGLRSINKIAEKYHGAATIDYSESKFILKVILCNL